jgi:ATP/maltotriose-dependent transcriptional regulator MalT
VEAELADGDRSVASACVAELRELATATASPSFAALADQADAAVALAGGDAVAALDPLRRACATWNEIRLPYEHARARRMLGTALRAAGDEDGGAEELRAAGATFDRLGARLDVASVDALLRGRAELPDGLTAREVEVLRLVASGKTNKDIAVELVLSEHTIGRHLQNIYGKIRVGSRAAATAYAFEHGLA